MSKKHAHQIFVPLEFSIRSINSTSRTHAQNSSATVNRLLRPFRPSCSMVKKSFSYNMLP